MKTPLALALSALMLAGCFGYGPGGATVGDTVHGTATFYDAVTGDLLGIQDFELVVGEAEPFGADAGRALLGATANDTVTMVVAGVDGELAFGVPVALQESIPGFPFIFQQDRDTIEGLVDGALVNGTTFEYNDLTFRVSNVTESSVDVEPLVVDGMQLPVQQYGLLRTVHFEGDGFYFDVTGVPGFRFTIPASPETGPAVTYEMQPAPDGKPRVAQADHVVAYPQLYGHDQVRVELVIEHIVLDGNYAGEHYGVRRSPQLLAPSSEPVAVDDGHGHA